MQPIRPVYLNLFKIRLPVTGIVSLAHRVSGVLLFIAIPFLIYLVDISVSSEQGFADAIAWMDHPFVVLFQLMLIWSLAHHFFAGIRFLFLDFDIGITKSGSTMTAWLVIVVELLVVALFLVGVLM
jgi:succinate dehydrogenase / fumarate reductase cytochrome b subunit